MHFPSRHVPYYVRLAHCVRVARTNLSLVCFAFACSGTCSLLAEQPAARADMLTGSVPAAVADFWRQLTYTVSDGAQASVQLRVAFQGAKKAHCHVGL